MDETSIMADGNNPAAKEEPLFEYIDEYSFEDDGIVFFDSECNIDIDDSLSINQYFEYVEPDETEKNKSSFLIPDDDLAAAGSSNFKYDVSNQVFEEKFRLNQNHADLLEGRISSGAEQISKAEYPLKCYKSLNSEGNEHTHSSDQPSLGDEHLKTYCMSPADENSFTCLKCRKTYIYAKSYVEHEKLCGILKDCRYKCDKCPKKFKYISHLKLHSILHTDEKPFTCQKCRKGFNFVYSRDNHERFCGLLAEDYPHSCNKCKKKFKAKSSLKQHSVIHTDEKPFTCQKCGKGFNFVYRRDNHERFCGLLAEDYPYSCDNCQKKFKDKSNLKQHSVIHTDEKPFTCQKCGKCFNRVFSHDRHERACGILAEDYPYSCDKCQKKFKDKGNLKQHSVIHTGEKTFTCQKCGKGFYRAGNRIKHQKSCRVKADIPFK